MFLRYLEHFVLSLKRNNSILLNQLLPTSSKGLIPQWNSLWLLNIAYRHFSAHNCDKPSGRAAHQLSIFFLSTLINSILISLVACFSASSKVDSRRMRFFLFPHSLDFFFFPPSFFLSLFISKYYREAKWNCERNETFVVIYHVVSNFLRMSERELESPSMY